MAIRNIITTEDSTLRKKSRKVETIDRRIQILIDDMFETMYDAGGVGLAAVQVGVLKQVIVIDTDEPGEKLVLINPEIIATEGENNSPEGCLSIPGKAGYVKRPDKVTVRAMDRDGNVYEKTGTGLLAKAFCHEIDHLSGELYIDKVNKWMGDEE